MIAWDSNWARAHLWNYLGGVGGGCKKTWRKAKRNGSAGLQELNIAK